MNKSFLEKHILKQEKKSIYITYLLYHECIVKAWICY